MNLRWQWAQKAELKWWKQYLRRQEPAEYLHRKAIYWRRVLEEAGFAPQPGERVLDAGCGPAGIFIILQNQLVDAVDPLLDAYQADLSVFRKENYPYVRFFAEALEIFCPSVAYPTVFCLNAVNHVRDIEKSFDVLAQAVAPGGTLLLSVDAHRFGFLKYLFRLLPGDILHPQQFDDAEYRAMMEQRGFVIRREIILKQELLFRHYLYAAQKITGGNDR